MIVLVGLVSFLGNSKSFSIIFKNGNFCQFSKKISTHCISIRILWHIVVKNDVNSFDIDTSSKKIGCDQDSSLKVLELAVPLQSLLLVHTSVDIDGWEVLVLEKLVQSDASLNGFDENNDLVEFERVQEVEQFSVLF